MPIHHTLDQLLALEAIAQTGTFAGAAAALHRVPSAISYAIKGLEDALELQLFDRSGRRAELTPAGREVLNAARSVLEEARALEAIALRVRDGWEPQLHIVVDGVYPMAPITRAIRQLAEDEIPTRIRLDVEFRQGVVDRFVSERADLMLVLGLEEEETSFDTYPLPPLDMVLVVAAAHPLGQTRAVGQNILLRHMELVVRDSSAGLLSRDTASWMRSPHVMRMSDFHSKRHALLDRVGFGWMPRHLVAADLEDGALVLVDHEPHTWTYHPQLVARPASLGRTATRFIASLTPSTIQKK